MSDGRVFYRDNKPYEAPTRLEQLQGPRRGLLELPINVYWGPDSVVDLDTEGGVMKAYQAVLREGSLIDQEQLLNSGLLVEVWHSLMLPVRVRMIWEDRFPELVASK